MAIILWELGDLFRRWHRWNLEVLGGEPQIDFYYHTDLAAMGG